MLADNQRADKIVRGVGGRETRFHPSRRARYGQEQKAFLHSQLKY